MIRHILLIRFKASATDVDIEKTRELFEAIPNKIEGVISVEWGVNDSLENLNQGFTHSVLMSFADEPARQHYLPHPEHESLKTFFTPLIDNIIVFDYKLKPTTKN